MLQVAHTIVYIPVTFYCYFFLLFASTELITNNHYKNHITNWQIECYLSVN